MMLIHRQEISKKLCDNYEMRYISISRIRMKKSYTTRKTLTKTHVINAKSRTGIRINACATIASIEHDSWQILQ